MRYIMEDINFVLPISKDDLLECNSPPDRYSVATVTDEKEVFKKLRDIKRDLTGDNNPYIIFDCFDVIFSALFHFQKIDSHAQKRVWHVTVRACSQFKDHLEGILPASDIDANEKKKCVNALKMLVYLLTQQITCFENLLDKKSTKEDKKLSKPKGGAKGRKNNDLAGDGSLEFDWAEESRDAMVLIHHLIQLPIQKLWATPLVEEQFVSMVGNCCYKLLDDPDIHLVKLKPMRDLIFDVLGILVKYHVHTNIFVSTIVKSLKGTENVNSANILAKGVLAIAQKYHIQGLVCCVVNEVATNGIPEFSSDSNAARTYSDFLLQLAEGDPVLMMPGVDILMPLLDQDPYQLRNCVLGVLAAVLQQDLKLGDLEDEKREAFREEIYTTLLDHFMDNHAFVRSKVCQTWINLFEVKAVPMSRHAEVLEAVVDRLEDKSAQVRKYAMQLVTAFLEEHDFVAKHGVDGVKSRLNLAKVTLAKMTAFEEEITLEKSAEVSWINIEAELEAGMLEALESDAPDDTLDAGAMKKALDTCRRLLAVRKFSEAILMLRMCEIRSEPTHSTFSLSIGERIKLYKGIVKRLMFGGVAAHPRADEASAETGADTTQNTSQSSEPDSFPDNPFMYINVLDKDVINHKELVVFLQASHDVGVQLNSAVPLIRDLLTSSLVTDVTEAVDFFTAAQNQSLDGISEGLHDMLELIWSPDEAIKAVITEAFKIIYLDVPNVEDTQVRAHTVVDNLTQLVLSPTLGLGEKAALEMLVTQWIEKNYVTPATLLILWDRCHARVETTDDESRAALILLTMVARSEKKWSMVKNNIEELMEHGFGSRGNADFRIALHTCQLLSHLAPKKIADTADGVNYRLPNDHRIFTSVSDVILKGLLNFANDQYVPMATEALNLIFKLAERPDQIFETLGKDLIRVLVDAGLNDKKSKSGHKYSAYFSVILSRLFSCIGHIGILFFHYLDKDIYNEIKKHRALNEKGTEKKKHSKKRRSAASFASKQSSTSFATSITSMTENDDELEGITAEDEDAEFIKGVCDKQILASSNFLGNLSQLLEFAVTHPKLYEDVKLQTAATMALGKMMAISQTFCEKNQENLVSYTLKADDPVMRSNGLLILRDLAFRFPTQMEPTISHLYTMLHDESRDVRANSMAALSSLILTEMVKAKSNIGQLARCIVDKDLDMVQRAKSLFKMMSEKGNQLYNALPDIISKLSSSEEKVEEEEFRTILKFIMSLIQKDRQHELLVEKLCARFKLTEDERQWRDLAFCLSLLTYSDRSLRKLLDNMTNYADKLHHEPVFNLMQSIADQTFKQAKPEMRPLIEEFITRLLNCQEKGIDDGACTQKTQKDVPLKQKKARSKKTVVPGSSKKKSRRTRASSTTSEEDSEGYDSPAPAKPSKKVAAKTPARAKGRSMARRGTTPQRYYNDNSSSNEDQD